jgi:O-antigen ligase
MFAIPGILALIFFVYIRPQEFAPKLQTFPFLYVCFGLAVLGYMLDLRLRLSRWRPIPQTWWILAYFGWCMATLIVRDRQALSGESVRIGVAVVLAFCIGNAIQTLRAFQWTAAVILGCALLLSVVGIHQSLQPKGCLVTDDSRPGESSALSFDGRPCETYHDCENANAEPGADYSCERVGVLGTTTIGGRVRYIGLLEDPNNLALALGIALPFAFAFFERKRATRRLVLLLLAIALIFWCTFETKSRSGQVVFLAVIGAYTYKRWGVRGLALGMMMALPIVLFGGRSGEEAESSTVTRLECWTEGMSMLKATPIIGVGAGQFVEHHSQTAHNSYILAAAETGLPGFLLWSAVMYLSTKIPFVLMRRYVTVPEARPARTWSMAMIASMAGLLVGVFFLSFCYHHMLWIYVGLTGALYSVARTHDPELRINLTWRDLGIIVAVDFGVLALLLVYVKIKAP